MGITKEPRLMRTQLVCSAIPLLSLWAAYRIQKLRVWLLLGIGLQVLIPTAIPMLDVLPMEISGIVFLAISTPISVLAMYYFTREWNTATTTTTTATPPSDTLQNV